METAELLIAKSKSSSAFIRRSLIYAHATWLGMAWLLGLGLLWECGGWALGKCALMDPAATARTLSTSRPLVAFTTQSSLWISDFKP